MVDKPVARWIWRNAGDHQPRNAHTWFRRVVELAELPACATLHFAANSNARLIINGHILRRKVTRYSEDHLTADVVEAGPWLRQGRNVVLVRHHNWGPIITFQRTGNSHAGLYIQSDWLVTDTQWRWAPVPEMLDQPEQVTGVVGSAPRIRYGLQMDMERALTVDPSLPDFDDSAWQAAAVIPPQPWSQSPPPVAETRRQREYFFPVQSVLNAGHAETMAHRVTAPSAISGALREAKCHPNPAAAGAARPLALGGSAVIEGAAGETRYLTVDFQQPVHGYPRLVIDSAVPGAVVDIVYAEIPRSLYNGRPQVSPDGWIHPELVVGTGYTDRIILRTGRQELEIPDERTARWMAMYIHFPAAGRVVVAECGLIKSQYTINMVGSFECGDPQVDRIVRLMLTHAEVTMSDCYVDTPGREDGQWIEDAQLRAVLSSRWFGETALRRFLLRTHIDSQGPEGNTHPFAPSNYPVGPATFDWSLQWVSVLFDEYWWTGDGALISEYWDRLCRYLDHVTSFVDEAGLWRTAAVFADIRMGTQPTAPDHASGIVTPMLYEKLEQAATMAEVIGATERAVQWRDLAARIAAAFRRNLLAAAPAPHVHTAVDGTGAPTAQLPSQSAATIAVYTGLVPSDAATALVDHAFAEPDGRPPAGMLRWNNPTWSYRALRAMSHVGRAGRAMRHLKERCAPYLPAHPANPVPLALQGPAGGPLPEYWVGREDAGLAEGEILTPQPEDDTGSHGWAAVPLAWLHESVLGVTIAQPGGARLRIAPDHAGLPFIAGWTVTPRGPVHVYLDPADLQLAVILPPDVEATIIVPPVFAGRRVRATADSIAAAPDGDGVWRVSGPGRLTLECF